MIITKGKKKKNMGKERGWKGEKDEKDGEKENTGKIVENRRQIQGRGTDWQQVWASWFSKTHRCLVVHGHTRGWIETPPLKGFMEVRGHIPCIFRHKLLVILIGKCYYN